ncbi:hypothetical protein [Scytonema sp. PRP1]|uniref:hypothetical protein n=1 Tax=Scytonema sp. PRP1 TaxID=3120513 RepID=UPI003FA68877
MIDHDRSFKELLTTFFVEFLELFFPEVIAYLEPNSFKSLSVWGKSYSQKIATFSCG